jgi:hypothetical protein
VTGAGGDVGRQPRWECTVLAELARRGRARAQGQTPVVAGSGRHAECRLGHTRRHSADLFSLSLSRFQHEPVYNILTSKKKIG